MADPAARRPALSPRAGAPCYIGVDLGTSGCRAIAITRDRRIVAEARSEIPAPIQDGSGGAEQAAEIWWRAVLSTLRALAASLVGHVPGALCVDGTSSTLLLCGTDGTPLAPALMYNDSRSREEAERIAAIAPAASAARGAGSSLAKLLRLKRLLNPRTETLALHQTDWITGRLTGRYGISDWNNCLKLGYDPGLERWPDWIARLDLDPVALPRVVAPGSRVGQVSADAADATELPAGLEVIAGTTDSTAAVIAAGARQIGEAVTSLGSTLVVKILASAAINVPEYGVYSQRYGDSWLVGGASNSGGAVLRTLFSDERIRQLTTSLRPDRPTGLDYYPLPGPGERFPVNDPDLAPRLGPRPASDGLFFQGVLEGIARIEAAAYERLASLGAPAPSSVLTLGGGADNPGWTRIRERTLDVPVRAARVTQAAFGAALLALDRGVPS